MSGIEASSGRSTSWVASSAEWIAGRSRWRSQARITPSSSPSSSPAMIASDFLGLIGDDEATGAADSVALVPWASPLATSVAFWLISA